MTQAIARSDRSVWIYAEQPKWWTDDQLPLDYIDALRDARSKIELTNPNGLIPHNFSVRTYY